VRNKYISIMMQVTLYLWCVAITLGLTVIVVSATTQLVTLGFLIIGAIVGYPLYRGAKHFRHKWEEVS
jgi:hypothetical protein